MVISAKLTIDKKEYLLKDVRYDTTQRVDGKGFPLVVPKSGLIDLFLPVPEEREDPFMEWALTHSMTKNGFITFHSHHLDKVERKVIFTDALCVKCHFDFNHQGKEPFMMYLRLSARVLEIDGIRHENIWPVATNYVVKKSAIVEKKDETKPVFYCVAHFFRSTYQEGGKIGSGDKSYTGNFGFDRYEEKYDGTGAKSSFSRVTIGGEPYYIPWLTIWPPSQAIAHIKEIDPSYQPGNKVTLKLKIEEEKKKDKGSGDLVFTSDPANASILINGTKNPVVSTRLGALESIDIECTDVLRYDVRLRVTEKETGNLVGALNIMHNDNIGVLEPEMIEVNLVSKNPTGAFSKKTATTYNDLFDFFNTKAFNQALVYVKQPSIVQVMDIDKSTLPTIQSDGNGKNYIDYNAKKQFEVIGPFVNRYYELKSNKSLSPASNNPVVTNTASPPDLDPLRYPALAMIKGMDKSFTKHIGKPNRLQLTYEENLKKIERYKKVRAKYPVDLAHLSEPTSIADTIHKDTSSYFSKNNALRIFISNDIDFFGEPAENNLVNKNPGFHNASLDIILAMKMLQQSKGQFVHEVGHALGLKHIFEEVIKKPLSENNKSLLQRKYSEFDGFLVEYKKLLNSDSGKFKIYNNKKSIILGIDIHINNLLSEYLELEKNSSFIMSSPNEQKQSFNFPKQEQSVENFMDYLEVHRQKDYKSFSYSQIIEILQKRKFKIYQL